MGFVNLNNNHNKIIRRDRKVLLRCISYVSWFYEENYTRKRMLGIREPE